MEPFQAPSPPLHTYSNQTIRSRNQIFRGLKTTRSKAAINHNKNECYTTIQQKIPPLYHPQKAYFLLSTRTSSSVFITPRLWPVAVEVAGKQLRNISKCRDYQLFKYSLVPLFIYSLSTLRELLFIYLS